MDQKSPGLATPSCQKVILVWFLREFVKKPDILLKTHSISLWRVSIMHFACPICGCKWSLGGAGLLQMISQKDAFFLWKIRFRTHIHTQYPCFFMTPLNDFPIPAFQGSYLQARRLNFPSFLRKILLLIWNLFFSRPTKDLGQCLPKILVLDPQLT